MKTTIFVPVHTHDAQWIFCNAEAAFANGLLNAAGKVLTGYHSDRDAIAAFMERQPQEPFALLHLRFDRDMQKGLSIAGYLKGSERDGADRPLWTLAREGSLTLFKSGRYKLLMEIVPVERSGIVLY
ncbi:MAG: hypothetical protein JST01_03315 [Cyanobacteria bacterium SZAS TMP-1]|nr:hypothetical protein [Cyanobacteria bacterium SZAS TMP-1]